MKTIIVFYSMEGNTEYAADKIAELTGAELLRIAPKKAYPVKGPLKFVWGGKSAVMGEMPPLRPYEFDAKKYDCIIIGFPVWAGNITPPIRTFVNDNLESLKEKKIAAFACQSGSGADKAFKRLNDMLNRDKLDATLVLIDPKDRPKSENENMIKEFCDKVELLQ